jgi:hypothetical protein
MSYKSAYATGCELSMNADQRRMRQMNEPPETPGQAANGLGEQATQPGLVSIISRGIPAERDVPSTELFLTALKRGILGCPYCGAVGSALQLAARSRSAPRSVFDWCQDENGCHIHLNVLCVDEDRWFSVVFRPNPPLALACQHCQHDRVRIEIDTLVGKVPFALGVALSCEGCGALKGRFTFEAFDVREAVEGSDVCSRDAG